MRRPKKTKPANSKDSVFGVLFGLVLFISVIFIGAFFIFSALSALDSGVAVGRTKYTYQTIHVLRQSEPVFFYLTTTAVFLVGAAVIFGLFLLVVNGGDVQISESRPMRWIGQLLMNLTALGPLLYLTLIAYEPLERCFWLALLVLFAWRLNSPPASLLIQKKPPS